MEIQSTGKFLSICAELNVCLWGFGDESYEVISCCQLCRPISKMISMKSSVIMAFEPNDTQMFRFDEELKDLVHIRTDTSDDHEGPITDIATFPAKNLYITGSVDGFVKIWNIKRQLIREIKFPEPVESVSFLNHEGDILVGHLGKTSAILAKDYMPEEILSLFAPDPEDVKRFFHSRRQLADGALYEQLKQADSNFKKLNMLSLTEKDGKSNEVADAKAAESMANTMTLASQHGQLKPKLDNFDNKRSVKIKKEEFEEDQSRDLEVVGSQAENSSSSDQEWDKFSHSALDIAPNATAGLLNRSQEA